MTLDGLGAHEQLGRHLAGGRSGDGQLHDLLLVRGEELGERGTLPGPGTSNGLELVGGTLRPRRCPDQLKAFVRELELLNGFFTTESGQATSVREVRPPLFEHVAVPASVARGPIVNCRGTSSSAARIATERLTTSAVKGRGSCSVRT